MSRRPRPYIPLSVRVNVAERQLMARDGTLGGATTSSDYRRLGDLLFALFAMQPVALDHNPPLRVRIFNERTGKYTPDANDPDCLTYRTVDDHKLKTNVRGDGAQFPDRVLIKRERRRDNPNKKHKTKWASRPFPKGRGFRR